MQYIGHILKTVLPLHWQLRGRQLLANVVRATCNGLNIRAGVDIAACAVSRIADRADHYTAICVLKGRDTARSCYKNLKNKRFYIS